MGKCRNRNHSQKSGRKPNQNACNVQHKLIAKVQKDIINNDNGVYPVVLLVYTKEQIHSLLPFSYIVGGVLVANPERMRKRVRLSFHSLFALVLKGNYINKPEFFVFWKIKQSVYNNHIFAVPMGRHDNADQMLNSNCTKAPISNCMGKYVLIVMTSKCNMMATPMPLGIAKSMRQNKPNLTSRSNHHFGTTGQVYGHGLTSLYANKDGNSYGKIACKYKTADKSEAFKFLTKHLWEAIKYLDQRLPVRNSICWTNVLLEACVGFIQKHNI